jgi:hypothetical protein
MLSRRPIPSANSGEKLTTYGELFPLNLQYVPNGHMQNTRRRTAIWVSYVWALLLTVTLAAVVWSEYEGYHVATLIAICAGGSLYWFFGFGLAGRGTLMQAQYDFAEDSEELCLKAFYLNGYFFQPYEQGTSSGRKQFRLRAMPSMSSEREAAFIRYLINEGLSEKMWPGISRRIEEEANWAFLA